MKFLRKWTVLTVVALILCALTISVWAAPADTETVYKDVDEMVYTVTAVNVRTGPGTANAKLGVLQFGASIRRIGIGSNGWSKVVYNGEVAYMYSRYLSTTRPNGYTDNLDDGELKRQIAIANGLNQMDYTAESWKNLAEALDEANRALGGNNQIAADESADKLKNAITALVRMDYASLEAVLSAVEKLVEEAPQNELWVKLLDATGKGTQLLTSGDQAAVDAATAEIKLLMDQLKTAIEEQKKPDVIVQQVPVEVPPSKDYCNISVHRVWMVLFIVSLAANMILVALIAVYVSRKKRNQRDDMPLVDYDINDDAL